MINTAVFVSTCAGPDQKHLAMLFGVLYGAFIAWFSTGHYGDHRPSISHVDCERWLCSVVQFYHPGYYGVRTDGAGCLLYAG